MAVRLPLSPVRENIASDIPSQFPAIYREDGALYVDFVKTYYEWLDEQPGDTREAFLVKDIDTTFGEFLVYYKNTYLNDLPFTDEESVRFAIKHIQDLYRRKGSEESLRLFFRLFFDEEIEVFYPSYAMLRASDSIWKIQRYLELKPVLSTEDYPIKKGDRIFGDNSSAEAYVDEVVFRNFRGALTPIAFLSNIYGEFVSDDGLTARRRVNGENVTIKLGRPIYGSIDSISVKREKREPDNFVGDKLKIVSQKFGFEAKGVVNEIAETTTGIIDFFIEDGGWGYATDNNENETLVTNQVIMINPKGNPINFTDFDEVLVLDAAITNTRPNDTTVYTDTVSGYGRVNWIEEDTNVIHLITTANSAFDNLNSFEPFEVDAVFGKVDLDWTQIESDLDDIVAGTVTSGPIYNFWNETAGGNPRGDVTDNGSITQLDIDNIVNYSNDVPIVSAIEDRIKTHIVDFVKFNVNKPTVVNTTVRDRYLTIAQSDTHKIILTRTYNDTADYNITTVDDTETIRIITDPVGDFINTSLDASDYDMSGSQFTNVNLNTTFEDAFITKPLTIGAINGIGIIDDGFDYTFDVKSKVIQQEILGYDIYDVGIQFDRNDFVLIPGDVIIQERQVNSLLFQANVDNNDPETPTDASDDTYYVRAEYIRTDGAYHYFRMKSFFGFDDDHTVSIQNNNYTIVDIKKDYTSKRMGENADIPGEAFFASGQISKIKVVESGYRYRNGETVDIINVEPFHYINGVKVDNPKYNTKVAEAVITTKGTGFLEGRWLTPTSFISDEGKVLQDNDYYQEYSYDVSSLIKANRYEELLREKISVAGTKLFSSTLINSLNNFEPIADVAMEIYNLTTPEIEAEGQPSANTYVSTQSGEDLVAVIAELDETASATITQDIND